MADPPGEDTGKEWFEIYNASRFSVNLTGLELVASRLDGTSPKTHVMTSGQIEPGGYLVVGGVLPELAPDYVGYGYGADLGALRNSDGRLDLVCNDVVVDTFSYDVVAQGSARSYDGALVPDSAGNDDLARWCDATAQFDVGQFGTPSEANAVCGMSTSASTCLDGDIRRPLEKPMATDLVITEIMPNPDKVLDGDGEWFEVFVGRSVDLNGLQMGNVEGTVKFELTAANEACIRVNAGTHVVFGRKLGMDANGGLPVDLRLFSGVTLGNSGGTMFIGHSDFVIDAVSYATAPDGVAWSLDPTKRDAEENDDPAAWCRATAVYNGTDLGTPGAANTACPVVLPPGHCVMPGGNSRPLKKPGEGDLVITEYLPDPASTDTGKEWFEVLVKTEVDLNGLEMGNLGMVETLESSDCLLVAANSYVVFHRPAADIPSELPAEAKIFSFTKFNLPNSGTSRGIYLGYEGTLLDKITYLTITPTGKASRQLSNEAAKLDDIVNDDDQNVQDGTIWCRGTEVYNPLADATLQNKGTPGKVNRSCVPE